jgi:hypothetical protein
MSAPSPEAARRAAVLLDAIAGRCTVAEACMTLGIGEARYHQLRQRVLAAVALACEPGQPGRPAKAPPDPAAIRLAALEADNDALRFEVEAARVRELLALTMPERLLAVTPPPPAGEKKGARRRGRARR